MSFLQEWEERDYCPLSAPQMCEAETEMMGYLDEDRAWLLSDYDTWVKNPFYHGPEVPHPEYDCGDYELELSFDKEDEVNWCKVKPLVEDLVHMDAKRADRGLPPLNVGYGVDDLPF